jgi:V8-like Glu-specific endopeptidase
MATSPLEQLIESVRHQVAEGDVQLALDRLENYLSAAAPDLRDEVILITSAYNRLRRDERKGLVSYEGARVEYSRLSNAILDLVRELPRRVDTSMQPTPSPAAAQQPQLPSEVELEKILGINNLKQISWIEHGLRVARSVCRILTPGGLGTGFLIAPDLLMTNHHVLPDLGLAAQTVVEFNYQQDMRGNLLTAYRYRLDAQRFHSSQKLDYTIVGLLEDASRPPLESWGCVSLNPSADPVPGEHVTIIQHPNGGLKQIVLTANQVVSLWDHRLHYTTDTLPGSSGSPVFNDAWHVIAIHHAGGNLATNASGATRFINEGILMSAIKPDAGALWPQ